MHDCLNVVRSHTQEEFQVMDYIMLDILQEQEAMACSLSTQ